jgi:phosphoribosyl 1,2-cyclic phosphate phosphodiesterase
VLPELDLAILPAGMMEFHPLSGERLIPEEHPVLQHEATFQDTLAMIKQLVARQIVFGCLHETNQLSYDDCLTLEKRLDAGNITFACDQQIISV